MRDYGRRHYLSDREYQEQMRETTDFAVDSRIKLPHSEHKKPWAEDDYPTMEYAWDPPGFTPPGFPPWPDDIPDPSDPGTTVIPGDPWNPGGPGLGCLFYVPLTPGLLDPGETAFAKLARRDDPIVDVKVSGPAELVSDAKLLQLCTAAGQAQAESVLGNNNPSSAECVIVIKVNDELTEDEQAETILFVDVTATTRSGETCQTSAIVNQENCDDAAAVTYDDTNSPETISRGESKLVYITDGVPPFNWSVSGTGFTISSQTTSRYARLRATDSACGFATITVTDSCGDSDTGEVRCLDGSDWVNYGDTCVLDGYDPGGDWYWNGTAGTSYVYSQITTIFGGRKQYERIRGEFGWIGCDGDTGWLTKAECDACKASLCGTLDEDICLEPDAFVAWPAYPNDGDYYYCGGMYWFEECYYDHARWKGRRIIINGGPYAPDLNTLIGQLWECT